jgi:drug/metabolite transporter (DMT)-like permease
MQSDAKYWFPSKRYGWGWGLPIVWQGWLVFAVFFAMVLAGVFLFPPRQMLAAYLFYIAVLSVALLGVCWFKGEPPRWRWGNGEGAEGSR